MPFFDAFYDTGNSKKIYVKNMKNSGDARNFRSEISKSDIFTFIYNIGV